jgi:hypothetical protein
MSSSPILCPVVLDLPEITVRSITEILSNASNLKDPKGFISENLRDYIYKYIQRDKGFGPDLDSFGIVPIEAEKEDLNITNVVELMPAVDLVKLSLVNSMAHYTTLPSDIIGPEQEFVFSFNRLPRKLQERIKRLTIRQLKKNPTNDIYNPLHRIVINSMISKDAIEESIIDMSKLLPTRGNSFDLVHFIKIPKSILKRELSLEDFRVVFLEHGKQLNEKRGQYVNALLTYLIENGLGGHIESPEFVEKIKDLIEERKAGYQNIIDQMTEFYQDFSEKAVEIGDLKEKFLNFLEELKRADPYLNMLFDNFNGVTDENLQDFVKCLLDKANFAIEDFEKLSNMCSSSDVKKVITKLSSPLIDDMLSRIAVQVYLFGGLNYPYIVCLDVDSKDGGFYVLILVYGIVELASWAATVYEKNLILLKTRMEYGFKWSDVRTIYSISNIHPLDYFLLYETLLTWANTYRARKKHKWLRGIPNSYHKLVAEKELLVKMVMTDPLSKHCPLDFKMIYKALESNSLLIVEKYHLQENKRQSIFIPYVNTSVGFTRHLFEKKRNPNYPSYQLEKEENPEVANHFLAINYEKYLDCQINLLSVLLPYYTLKVLESLCGDPKDWILSKYYKDNEYQELRTTIRNILNDPEFAESGFIRIGRTASLLYTEALLKPPCYEWLIKEYQRRFREMFRPSKVKGFIDGKITKEFIPYAFAEALCSLALSNINFIWLPVIYPYYPLVLAVMQQAITETNMGNLTNIIDCPEAFDVIDLITEEILKKYGIEKTTNTTESSNETLIFEKIFSTETESSEAEIKEFAKLFFSLPMHKIRWFIGNCLKPLLEDSPLIVPFIKSINSIGQNK